MSEEISRRTAVITGASGGIGRRPRTLWPPAPRWRCWRGAPTASRRWPESSFELTDHITQPRSQEGAPGDVPEGRGAHRP